MALQLASRGFVVVSINYRLTGDYYGLDSDLPGITAAEDARAAIRFVRAHAEQARVDPNRIMLGGDSAGAITSLYVGYVKAAQKEGNSGNPGFNSTASPIFAMSGELMDLAYCKGVRFGKPYGCAVNNPEYDFTDNVNSPNQPPLVMVHGTSDLIVPYPNAKALYDRAQEVGLKSKLITIPGAPHVPWYELFTESDYLDQLISFIIDTMDLKDMECPRRMQLFV